MKPIIGVMPLWDDDKESLWMLPRYLDGIHQAGGCAIIFPLTQEENELKRIAELCDGFLFPEAMMLTPGYIMKNP